MNEHMKAEEALQRLKDEMSNAITDFAAFTGVSIDLIAHALGEINKPSGDTPRNRMIVFGVRQRNLVLAYERKIEQMIAAGELHI